MQENETFSKQDFSSQKLFQQYDSCEFIDCNFENVMLSDITFMECHFINCNLSNVKINFAAFKDVTFENCKLLGVNFNDSNPFLLNFTFRQCDLTLASFYQLVIKQTIFKDCNLQEVDFTETDLSKSSFDNSDLSLAIFENSNLEKSNLLTANNFNIDPEKNRLKKAIFSTENIQGLLQHLDIIIK